jgi:tetratricopeptide (TPR) repeat protein
MVADMSEKKRVVPAKIAETRMGKPQGVKPARNSEPAAVATQTAADGSAPPADAPSQLSSFEAAMKLFHARRFEQARALFTAASEGPERDIAQRARLHIAMCDRRLQQGGLNLSSAEEYYNYGVALINTRNLLEARASLEKALELAPNTDHIHYALALAQALSGDFTTAHQNLKRAIELEPRNRAIARQDADFAPLVNLHPFDTLLYPEKKSW